MHLSRACGELSVLGDKVWQASPVPESVFAEIRTTCAGIECSCLRVIAVSGDLTTVAFGRFEQLTKIPEESVADLEFVEVVDQVKHLIQSLPGDLQTGALELLRAYAPGTLYAGARAILESIDWAKVLSLDVVPFSGTMLKLIKSLSEIDLEKEFDRLVSAPIRTTAAEKMLWAALSQIMLTMSYSDLTVKMTQVILTSLVEQ
jgi:hypothetical protein